SSSGLVIAGEGSLSDFTFVNKDGGACLQCPTGTTRAYFPGSAQVDNAVIFPGLIDCVDDAAAAVAGIAQWQLYRNGSQVMIRVTAGPKIFPASCPLRLPRRGTCGRRSAAGRKLSRIEATDHALRRTCSTSCWCTARSSGRSR